MPQVYKQKLIPVFPLCLRSCYRLWKPVKPEEELLDVAEKADRAHCRAWPSEAAVRLREETAALKALHFCFSSTYFNTKTKQKMTWWHARVVGLEHMFREHKGSASHQHQTCVRIGNAKTASLAHLANPFIGRLGQISTISRVILKM